MNQMQQQLLRGMMPEVLICSFSLLRLEMMTGEACGTQTMTGPNGQQCPTTIADRKSVV